MSEIKEIIVGKLTYRGPFPNPNPNGPWKITVLRPSSKRGTSGLAVGSSWQTHGIYLTKDQAMDELNRLEQEAKNEPIEPVVMPTETAVAPRGRGRPPKILSLVPRTMEENIQKIIGYHTACQELLSKGAMYAVLCGIELHSAKAKVDHGQWMDWLEATCPISHRQADRYMQAAERYLARLKDAGQVLALEETLEGRMNDQQRASLIAEVKENIGDMTMRQLYLELGMVKEPHKVGGGVGKGRPVLTPELRAELALMDWRELVGNLRSFCLVSKSFVNVPPEELRAGCESLRECARAVNEMLSRG